jgi:gamma-glutamylcysteine synthetase
MCVAEKFWDWWMPESNRVGVPSKSFKDIKDYVHTIADFKPVYVVRNGKPIILHKYKTFKRYYQTSRAVGINTDGKEVSLTPEKSDIDLHNSCYWYNARISRYYTVENRVNDQQPPDALVSISALTLGLVSALDEAKEEISSYDWQTLRQMRDIACQHGLRGRKDTIRLVRLALRMLVIARLGLLRRGLGEEKFLKPLEERLCDFECPANQAADIFRNGGASALVKKWKL